MAKRQSVGTTAVVRELANSLDNGAAAMVGRHSGFTSRLKAMAPQMFTFHCALHRENLVAKRLHPALRSSDKPHKGKAEMQPNLPTFVC